MKFIFSKEYKSKSYLHNISKDMLNEFLLHKITCNNIKLKTICLEKNGKQKESMSFKTIVYKEIVKDIWETSEFYKEITSQFCFFIFQKTNIQNEVKFLNILFWKIGEKDLHKIREVWLDTQHKILLGNFNNFIKASDKKVAHIRPKGRNAKDVMISEIRTFRKSELCNANSSE